MTQHEEMSEVTDYLKVCEERMARWFAFNHLPEHLQEVSFIFARAAAALIAQVDRTPKRTVALRRLLEAKDAGVRACLEAEGS